MGGAPPQVNLLRRNEQKIRSATSPSIAALVRMGRPRSARPAKKDKPFWSSGVAAGITKKALPSLL
jgi:hypothetical protein